MFEKGVYSPRELTATEFSRLEATVADLGRSLPEARATATPGA
jgi:hypothetical protein